MNTRLAKLLAKIDTPPESVILDCYNQAVVKDVAMTITTRIDACNHYYLLERIEMEQNTDKPIYIGNAYNKGGEKGSDGGNIYDPSGICRTLTSYGGGAGQTYISEPCMYRVPYGKTRLGGIVPNYIAGTVSVNSHECNELVIEPIMEQPKIIQKVGDRGTDNYSIHEDYANCVPVNPMSDRGQLVVEPTDRVMQIGNTTEGAKRENPQRGRVYSMDGIAPTIYTCGGGNLEPQILEPVTCAMRGRNPENPSDRTSGIPTEQRIELGSDVANCLTSVQKDSLVVEPIALGYSRDNKPDENGEYHTHRHAADIVNAICPGRRETNEILIAECVGGKTRTCAYKEMPDGAIRGYDPNTADKRGISEEQYDNPESIASTVTTAHVPKALEPMVSAHPISHAHENPQPNSEFAPTLRATDNKCPPVVYEPVQYYCRIRKLHPIETYRLQDVDDEDIAKLMDAKNDKGKPLISKTKHYALAGNSITVAVLVQLFENLFYPKPKPVTQPIQLTLF